MRTLEEIRADILPLEKETEGLLGEILRTGGPQKEQEATWAEAMAHADPGRRARPRA